MLLFDILIFYFEVFVFVVEQYKYQWCGGYDFFLYINYLIKVSIVIIEIGKEENLDIILVFIFYDVIEDLEIMNKDLKEYFGVIVVDIVMELIDDMIIFYED